jgi:L-lactate dehydrogenase complex protein LldG
MTARDQMLARVRSALGRSINDPVPEPPQVRLQIPDISLADRPAQFTAALTALGGQVILPYSKEDVREAIKRIVRGRSVVTTEAGDVRTAEIGVNFADYALADTGSLVFLSESRESRLISLLPPVHIAVIARKKILSGLDELFTLVPQPTAQSSAMALITGPSRTADIEMRLVRGVHGPGEIHVIIVEDVTTSQGDASGET